MARLEKLARLLRLKRVQKQREERVQRGDDVREAPADRTEFATRVAFGCLVIAGLIALFELLFPNPFPELAGLEGGKPAPRDVTAPFEFVVMKTTAQLETERTEASAQVSPVYLFDRDVDRVQRNRLSAYITSVLDVVEGAETDRQKIEMLGRLRPALSETTAALLLIPESYDAIMEGARRIRLDAHDAGVIAQHPPPQKSSEDLVILVEENEGRLVLFEGLLFEEKAQAIVENGMADLTDDPAITTAVGEILGEFLVGNVILDREETEGRRREAVGSVLTETATKILKGQLIVEEGKLYTAEQEQTVSSLKAQRPGFFSPEAGLRGVLPTIGRILLSLLLFVALILYASVRRKQLLLETRCQLLFLVVVAVVMVVAVQLMRFPDIAEYLVPITFLAMLFCMLFDFELAVVAVIFTSVLAGLYTDYGLPFVIVSITAGTVAAHSVRRVRQREDFYWSGIRVVAAYAVAILASDIFKAQLSGDTLVRCSWGGLNAIVSMGIVVVALPLFERGFRVTTDLTLLELADMNKPLLKKMAMQAPGSYHHSIVVGNLAEAAADAIGADSLFARVASYYHDIGKLVSPRFFVENQQGLDAENSKHTGLRPKLSSVAISSHVKDGVTKARLERLPEPLIDVIREHHGTSVMEYFYNKAVEEAEENSEVSKASFSYQGPRPRSKESAIISLADTLEARVRSINETMSPKRIESEIDGVIEKRWHDHQLDDAELTLSDLRKIREAFFRVLVGMYHQRIKYPDQNGDPDSAKSRESTGSVNGRQNHRQTEDDRGR